MAKLVYAPALGAGAARREGSSPFSGTNLRRKRRLSLEALAKRDLQYFICHTLHLASVGTATKYKQGRIAQLVRAPRLHRGGPRFESLFAYHNNLHSKSDMYFVYILRSLKNKKAYVGITKNTPARRLNEHNRNCNKWTKENGPFELIYYEDYHCKADALHREKFLKSGIGNKLVSLIRDNFWPVSVSPTGRPPRGRG